MGIRHTFPDAAAARAAGKLLNLHSPAEIASAIEVLIDLLDTLGGDPDLEETDAEDSFAISHIARGNAAGAGCPIADPGGVTCSEDEPDMWGFADGDGPGCPISDPPEDDTEDRCLAGDDGCAPVIRMGEVHWGSIWDHEGLA